MKKIKILLFVLFGVLFFNINNVYADSLDVQYVDSFSSHDIVTLKSKISNNLSLYGHLDSHTYSVFYNYDRNFQFNNNTLNSYFKYVILIFKDDVNSLVFDSFISSSNRIYIQNLTFANYITGFVLYNDVDDYFEYFNYGDKSLNFYLIYRNNSFVNTFLFIDGLNSNNFKFYIDNYYFLQTYNSINFYSGNDLLLNVNNFGTNGFDLLTLRCSISNGNTGGENTGGENTGGENTGGENTGGENTGGENTGGENTGGENTGGENIGDDNTYSLNKIEEISHLILGDDIPQEFNFVYLICDFLLCVLFILTIIFPFVIVIKLFRSWL